MLKLIEIKKSFGRHEVLKQVRMEIGLEVMVLAGPNGSGKSTLLKIIAGIVGLDEGKVLFNGEDVTTYAPEARRVGYVPQNPALFSHMNIHNNIKYCMRNGWGSEETYERLINMLGLSKVLWKKPAEISGGFKSRVSLARALILKPKILLLDEPFSGLDLALKERLFSEFRALPEVQQIPVLYVTHDLKEARVLGDRFAVIVDGTVREIEMVHQVFDQTKHDRIQESGVTWYC